MDGSACPLIEKHLKMTRELIIVSESFQLALFHILTSILLPLEQHLEVDWKEIRKEVTDVMEICFRSLND